jgi:hypothetical protein
MDLFICDRHRGQLQLSTYACARLYRRAEAEEAKRLDLLAPCRGCQCGRDNADAHRVGEMQKKPVSDYAASLF